MQKKKIAALAGAGCLLLAAAAGAQEPAFNSAQQQIRNSMDMVLGTPAPMQPGSYPMQAAMSDAISKIDPAVRDSINEKLMKIMQQTIQETFSDARFMQEMQQRLTIMPSSSVMPAPVVTAPPAPAPPPSVEPLEDKAPEEKTKKP